MKNTLIFGCSGFVGGYLAEELAANGYSVFGTDIADINESIRNYIEDYFVVNILDYEKVLDLIKDCAPEYIINLAAISSVGASWRIPQLTIDVNVNGTLNILEAVRSCGIDSKILLIGSSEEYSVSESRITENYPINANNPYGISKVTQEHFAELYRNEYGMRIISTRTFNHTGVGQLDSFAIPSFVKQVAEIHNSGNPGVISVGNLGVKRDLGDVRDMVSAYRMILESNTQQTVFNVGSGICYSLEDILNYIISRSDQCIEVRVDSKKLRLIDNPIIWCDNTLIRDKVGWKPQYTVFDAIDAMFLNYTSSNQLN